MPKKKIISLIPLSKLEETFAKGKANILANHLCKRTKYLTQEQRVAALVDVQQLALDLGFGTTLNMEYGTYTDNLEGHLYLCHCAGKGESFLRIFGDVHETVMNALDYMDRHLKPNYDERQQAVRRIV